MLLQVKDWLCLNCQRQKTSGLPKATHPKSIKVSVAVSPQKDAQAQASMQNLFPQQGSKGDTLAKPVLPQTKENSCFELSHDKSQTQTSEPAAFAESEKVLGFDSSVISTASELISSAIQDEASMSPPSSFKNSTVSETSVKTSTPPTSHKLVSDKDFSPKKNKSITHQLRFEGKISELQTNKEQSPKVKDDCLSACPLCNENFKNNPSNFSACTSCKINVCNLCGFNPIPDQTEVRPKLCDC